MINNIFNFINLHNGGERKDKVLENVVANISFRGSNLWILACAIVIASIRVLLEGFSHIKFIKPIPIPAAKSIDIQK